MNRSEWTVLFLKLYAIYLLVDLISGIPGYVAGYIQYGNKELGYWLGSLIPSLLIVFVFVLIFWFYSQSISKWLWSDIDADANIPSPSVTDIHYVIISAIGIYLCVSTIPRLIAVSSDYFTQYMYLSSTEIEIDRGTLAQWYFDITVMIVKLTLGISLILGSQKIVHLLNKLRNIGLEKTR